MHFADLRLGTAARLISAAAFALLPLHAVAAEPLGNDLLVKVPKGTKLVVADDVDAAQYLLKLSGEQSKLAEDVSYATFSSGPLRLEALRAGAAQIGSVGDVPAILAQFSNAGVFVVAAVHGGGNAQLVTTAANSGIRTLADLKGKKIGVNDGTAQQAVLYRDLDAAGLGAKDIHVVKLNLADFVDALRAGQIDAAVLKEPDRARYLLTAGKGAVAFDNPPAVAARSGITYLYATRAALADPAQSAAVRDFVIHWYRAVLWKNAHQEAWISDYLIKDQKLKRPDALEVVRSQGNHWSIPGFTDDFIAGQQQTIDLLQKAGVFTGRHLDAHEEYDQRFAKINDKSKAAND